ncbi:MAG: type III pantothenate kinase [Actinobacteria bacterium]|nr:type III pantothenate kinase [Actinomycetota bacterium]
MLLAVDIGNTDTKVGVFDGSGLVARWAVHSDLNRTRAEYQDVLLALLRYHGAGPIRDAVLGSVVPMLTPVLAEALAAVADRPPVVVRSEAVPGIRLWVDAPGQVGVDRVANAYAVRTYYGGPAIVADFGSATTFDVVDAAGDLRGALIAPGMHTSARALTAAGAQLPAFRVERPARLVGVNTVGAMQSGVYWGYVHMVRGVIGHLRDELGAGYRAIATGGLAPGLVEDARIFDIVDPDITLKGLAAIHTALAAA